MHLRVRGHVFGTVLQIGARADLLSCGQGTCAGSTTRGSAVVDFPSQSRKSHHRM